MTLLISAVIGVLFAQTVLAEQRDNKPFKTVNGRTAVAAPTGPRVFAMNTPVVTAAQIDGVPSDGGRAFMGSGRQVAARSSIGHEVRRGGKAFRRGGRSAIASGETPAPDTEEPPPYYSKPGALIRTTGQLPTYEKTEIRAHTPAAGEIALNKRQAFDVGRAPAIQQGPKDTRPKNPGSSAGGAAANSENDGEDKNRNGTFNDAY